MQSKLPISEGMPAGVDPNNRLWAAVLQRAYDDLSSPIKRHRSSARFYFFKSAVTGLGSLAWICDEVLDMSAAKIRKRLKAYAKAEELRMTVVCADRAARREARAAARETKT
jgi:hypothetical protein